MVDVTRRISVSAVVSAVACAIAGCGSKQDDVHDRHRCGHGADGALASYDQPSLAGFKMAIDEINARGGLGGKHPVKLLVRDTRSDTATTAAAAQELVDEGAKIMITPCDADPSIVAGQITQPAGMPTLTFCGSSPILPGAVGNMMFSTYPTDNLQATALAKFAYESGLRKVYLLASPDSTYTSGLPEYFGSVFTKLGGTVVGKGSFAMNQPDFSVAVTTIRNLAEAPDLIMTAAYEPDFPAFIRQLRASGVSTPVYGADALGTPTIAGLGELVERRGVCIGGLLDAGQQAGSVQSTVQSSRRATCPVQPMK